MSKSTMPNNSTSQQPALLGQGFVWQDLSIGQRFRTFRRAVRRNINQDKKLILSMTVVDDLFVRCR